MSLGIAYTVTMDAQAATAAQDLVEIGCPADSMAIVDKIVVTQETQTSSEALAIQCHRAAASGTGTATTPQPLMEGAPASAVTSETNHTVDTTPGVILFREGWNVLAPFIWHPTPEERIIVSPSQFLVVRLDVAPGASMTLSAVVAFREIAG